MIVACHRLLHAAQGPLKAASVNQLQAEYAVLAQRLEDETREKEQLEQQLASLKKEADNLKHRLSVFEQQQQAMNRAGGSMNYCQAPGENTVPGTFRVRRKCASLELTTCTIVAVAAAHHIIISMRSSQLQPGTAGHCLPHVNVVWLYALECKAARYHDHFISELLAVTNNLHTACHEYNSENCPHK